MKKNIQSLIVLSILVLFFSCSKKTKTIVAPSTAYDTEESIATSEEADTPPVPKKVIPQLPKVYVLASLQKTGCFGNCPDYEFVLLSNGEATFHGKKNTSRTGTFKARASAGFLFNFKSKIKETNFFQFEKIYPTNGRIIDDLPDAYILVNDGKQQLTIRNNHDAPKALLDFQEYIEEMMEKLDWEE